MNDQPTTDSKLVQPGLERIRKHCGTPGSCTTARDFGSPVNTVALEKPSIENAICPKSPIEGKTRRRRVLSVAKAPGNDRRT
jgi:hypothetical protein